MAGVPRLASEWRLVCDASWSDWCVFTQFSAEPYKKNPSACWCIHFSQCCIFKAVY